MTEVPLVQATFQSIESAKKFVLAGNALITLQSEKTGNHFTYKVQLKEDEKPDFYVKCEASHPIWFVKVLSSGSADAGEWTYIGMIRRGYFGVTKKTLHMADAPCVKAFKYFMQVTDLAKSQLVVRHENKCGRCGRTLTHPESIDSGFGPECIEKMNQ